MTAACSSWVPCEKFSRATSIPASTSRASTSGEREAGPIVQTILVRGMERKSNGSQKKGRRTRIRRQRDTEGEIVSAGA